MPDVIMPQMGESIVEGTVTKWFKKVGERVERDEPLFEISTDKVDTEIPAPSAGVVSEILVNEGQTVQVNTIVARIAEGDGAAAAKAPAEPAKPATGAPKPPEPPAKVAAPPPPPKPAPEAERQAAPMKQPPGPAPVSGTAKPTEEPAPESEEDIRSSPLVRRLAKEQGIDLRQVKGTGQGGRISKQDIEAYLAQRGSQPAAPPPPAASGAPAGPALPTTAFPSAPHALFGHYRTEKLSTMRQRIAEHMALTKHVAPHVSTVQQVDATKIARLRDRVKEQFERDNGVKLTYLPFFVRAACAALKAFPIVNASLDGTNVVYHQEINVGIAVAVDGGLIVPVIRSADEKNFLGIQRAIQDLAQRARNKQLKADEVQQGTFSISNYGSFGSLFATPAINQPQAAILGLGVIHKAPVVIDDAIAIRTIAYITLSFDHRILDGAIADQFLGHIRKGIEEWGEEVL